MIKLTGEIELEGKFNKKIIYKIGYHFDDK